MADGGEWGNVNDELSESINSFPNDVTPPGGVAYTPADGRPAIDWGSVFAPRTAESSFDWTKALDKGLSAWLQKETIDSQRQLLMAGRAVGYMPGYGVGNPYAYRQPLNLGGLMPLLIVGAIVMAVAKAAK